MRSLLFLFSTVVTLTTPLHTEAAIAPPRARKPSSIEIMPTRLDRMPQTVRVLLGQNQHVSISGTDLFVSGQRLAGQEQFSLRCGHDAEGAYIDYGAGRVAYDRLDISSPAGFLRVDRKLYRSRISIISRGDLCTVINTLPMEKYLAGLLNKEMSPSWPIEALKAQAVAARTYAIHQMIANPHRDYDLDSTVLDQVYDGASSETPRSTQAVMATEGMVLTFGSQPLKAYFHANCGGVTDVPVSVWGSHSEAFRSVVCPYHRKKRDRTQWSVHLTRAQLENAVRRVAGLLPTGFARVAHLDAAPSPNQRLSEVVVSDSAGNNLTLSANALRTAIGTMKIKSTAFRVDEEQGGFHIEGEGFGHGVGMCQVGARAMAEEGKLYREILSFYYPLAQLRRL